MTTYEQAASEEKDAEIATAEINCRAYQQIIKEKDATIGELQKSVGNHRKAVTERTRFGRIYRCNHANSVLFTYCATTVHDLADWNDKTKLYHNFESGVFLLI